MARKPYLALALLSSALLFNTNTKASVDNLLPRPQHVELLKGRCNTSRLKPEGFYLQDELKELLTKHGSTVDARSPIVVRMTLVPSLPKVFFNKEEAYRLRITPSGIFIDAPDLVGMYRGLQTLEQLLMSAKRKGELEACDIIDWPSFRMRGLMLGLGDTFVPMDELKKRVRLLSQYKVNTLHLHLTGREAWRLESKRYPQLTQARLTTNMPGKYYTLAELQELAHLCQEHRITLIPEIDMTGANSVFSRAMGFDMQTPQGKRVLKEILSELAEGIDMPYIHLGTDEASSMDRRFLSEMVAHVRSLGKKAIAWDSESESQGQEVDHLHLSSPEGVSVYGQPAVGARLQSLDQGSLLADLEKLYSSRILGLASSTSSQRGAILCVWGDRPAEAPLATTSDSGVYPHMLALAERAWLGGGSGYFALPTKVVSSEASTKTREAFIDFERRLLWHKAQVFVSEPFSYVAQPQGEKAIPPTTTTVSAMPQRPKGKGNAPR